MKKEQALKNQLERMESSKQTEQQTTNVGGADINIDINGDPDSSGAQVASSTMKNMNADEGSRVGLTKDELMKYANEPFWIRLRNILFASFWIIWVSILIAAIGYVVQSPGCKVVSASPVSQTSGGGGGSSSG